MAESDQLNTSLPAVYASSIVPTKLRFNSYSNNYEAWREQMLCLIESQGMLRFIDCSISPPLPAVITDQEYVVWKRRDVLVNGLILCSLNDDLVSSVANFKTASQVWLELERKFTNHHSNFNTAALGSRGVVPHASQLTEISVFEQNHLDEELLTTVLSSGFLDVALDLINANPQLGTGRYNDRAALEVIAEMNYVFASGESFKWWENFIYSLIPTSAGDPNSPVTSAGGDVENQSPNPLFMFNFGGSQKLNTMLWKVLQHLEPRFKDIWDKKVKHQQALELVIHFCKRLESLPYSESSPIYEHSIILAAESGIREIIQVIIEMHPMLIYAKDRTGSNIIHLAVKNRSENVFNLIYQMSGDKNYFYNSNDKNYFYNSKDILNNNLLHSCAKLAPSQKLNLVPGAALQMQRELQWFKMILRHLGWMDIDYAIRKDESPQTTENNQPDDVGLYEKWERSNRLCVMFIKTNITDGIKGSIDQCNDVRKLLNAIDEQFVSSDKALTSILIMKFFTMRLTGVKGVLEHIMRMKDAVAQLQNLEVTMSETFLVHYILNVLPQQYGPFKISYNTHKDKWFINELLTMCVQDEGRLLMECRESVHLATQGNTKYQAKGKGKEKMSPQGGIMKEFKCFFCKKTT